ncbi:MAG: hypothetical protein HY401_08035 [Elusimicrobia bacterium]|nr:hypothetical protein [Elusimicrobiota bacterium]
MRIIQESVSLEELHRLAKEQFGDFVKAVVDVELEVMAVGGELHADEEAVLMEKGSRQRDLWGINLYPEKSGEEWLEYDSMINVRPSQNNRSRGVEDAALRAKIREIVKKKVSRS